MRLVIREKDGGRAFAQFTHVFGISVKLPAIGRHRSNGLVNRLKVRIRTFHDFFRRQRIDWIERSYNYAELVGLGAKRTDSARHIQDSFSYQINRLEQKIAAILFECATEQDDPIKLKPALGLHEIDALRQGRGD